MKRQSTNNGTNLTAEGGFGVLPAFIHRSPELTCLEKCVLLDLSQYCGGGGMGRPAWPRVSILAAHQGVSRASMHRALKRLYDMGLVKKTKRHRADGSRSSNIYQLRFDAWNKSKISPVQRGCLTGDTGGSTGETYPNAPAIQHENEQQKHNLKVMVCPSYEGEEVFVDIWKKVLQSLAANTEQQLFKEWYSPLTLCAAARDAGFVLGCPGHMLEEIKSNHKGRIKGALHKVARSEDVTVHLFIRAL